MNEREPIAHFKAILQGKDGVFRDVYVGPEDLLMQDDGKVMGLMVAHTKPGDTLIDIFDVSGEKSVFGDLGLAE